jgi:NDP-sugar pyrophosphorylase family protein
VPPVYIGKGCEISQNAQVGPYTVLGDGCYIRSGAAVKNSILWAEVTVGRGLTVQNSILGEGVAINKNVNNDLLVSEN